MHNDQYAILANHIRRFVSLSQNQEEELFRNLHFRILKNKEYLLREEEVCTANYFIKKGCLRKYIDTESGKQQIIQFSIENWWMTDYTSLESGKPSTCNIQAVGDCEIIILNKLNQEKIFETIPVIESYFRKVLQRAFEASLSRIHHIFSFSGEERYHNFNNAFPEFVQRIPQYMLASYLGFTPEFLSKLRARKL
jgi:CRP/FNR family transcriptional regulator, anaerobic regulatory protein